MHKTLIAAGVLAVASLAGAGTASADTPQQAPPAGPPTPVQILEDENPAGLADGGTAPDNIAKNAGGLAGNLINTVELMLPLP
jgi:hypothetical protein